MAIVRLEEVIKRVQTKENKENTDRIYYVGGEHIDSENFRVTRRGLIEGSTIGPMFYYGFKAGDFLLVSRNPHLKKAGVVNFDGICSEKTFVLATADEDRLLPEFLPFVLQNDLFWDYACQHRHGSTNTFINWSTLASYEFELPDIQAQRRIANVLWTILDTIDSYKKLIAATDELVKAQFIEMFGDPATNSKGWPEMSMKEASLRLSDGPFGSNLKSSHYAPTGIRVIRLQNICAGYFLDDDKAFVPFEHYEKIKKYTCHAGDIVIGTLGEPNLRACIIPVTIPVAINKADCVHYIPKPEILNKAYVCGFINNPATLAMAMGDVHGNTRQRISSGQIANMKIMLPPLTLQNRYDDIVQQTDKSKFELERVLTAAKAMMKGIVEENLG